MSTIEIRKVTKKFGDFTAVRDADLSVAAGEVVCLLGPSGCGKTTTLRMIAGLETATSGSIRIGDRDVTDLRPGLRNCSMVFQNYALYPHMTVADNMAFSMRLRGAPKSEIDERVSRAAAILGLSQLLQRFPRQLSGGQRQRVAMGRAIVRDPQVFLFDEPLSTILHASVEMCGGTQKPDKETSSRTGARRPKNFRNLSPTWPKKHENCFSKPSFKDSFEEPSANLPTSKQSGG